MGAEPLAHTPLVRSRAGACGFAEFCERGSKNTHAFITFQAAHAVGIHTLPNQLTEEMAQDTAFLRALHHILMHVHVVNGTMECPVTQRQFPIRDEIPDMMLADEECERVR